MKKIISTRFSNGGVHFSLFILRVGLGLMMLIGHGWNKLLHFTQMSGHFADPFHIGSAFSLSLVIFSEVFCAAFVALGLFTRLAVIPLIIQMFTVIFLIHAADGFGRQELGVHFLLGFIVLLILGPGKVSIDGLSSKK